MNMHNNLRKIRTMASGALLVTGLVTVSGVLSIAQAQELEYAQKLMGPSSGNSESIQYRSTIIDPSKAGKSMNLDATKLRVIPVSNPAELSASKHSCAICGVVESISLTVNKGLGIEPDEGEAMENVVSRSGSHYRMFHTDSTRILPTKNNRNDASKKQAPRYEVKVRMSDGTLRIVNQPTQPDYAVGDYVRVISGAITAA